jgi:transcriptional regulator with GAF, ATPase, and Fis domain
MVYDAVSIHRDRILSMESFLKVLDRSESKKSAAATQLPEQISYAGVEQLPTFAEAIELLVTEAMVRAKGNQSIAARLLGITQSALCKRLKRHSRELLDQ